MDFFLFIYIFVHISFSALRRVEELLQEDTMDRNLSAIKLKVFRKAIDLIMEVSLKKVKKPDLERILQSFPDASKLEDDRKWLPCTYI